MDLATYLSIARRWWWTLLVATWVAGLAGFIIGSRIPRTYDASTRVLVGPVNGDLNTLRASGFLVLTYADLAVSEPLIEQTRIELALPESASELRRRIRTTANDSTRFLTLHVEDGDPERAAQIANAIVEELVQFAGRGTTRPEGELLVTDFATAPTAPASPNVPLIVLLAAGSGFLGALLLVILLERLNRRVTSPADLVSIEDAPVMATLEHSGRAWTALLRRGRGEDITGAQARVLAMRLRVADGSERRLIGVMGMEIGDGSDSLVAELVAAYVSLGYRTAVVDAARLNPPEESIPTTAPRGGEVRGTPAVPAGSSDPAAAVAAVVRRSRDVDVLIVHLDPMLDRRGLALGAACDGVVVAVRRGAVLPELVASTIDLLRLEGANILGIVLHDLRERRARADTPVEVASSEPASGPPDAIPPSNHARPAASRRAARRPSAAKVGDPE